VLGSGVASLLFGVALLASGRISAVTGTRQAGGHGRVYALAPVAGRTKTADAGPRDPAGGGSTVIATESPRVGY